MSVFNNAFLALIGVVLSAYSVYVEHKTEHLDDGPDGEDFQALCDIKAIGASCSAVFSLPEGKMLSFFGIVPEGHALDIPNGVLGMLFYSYILIRYFTSKQYTGLSTLFTPTVNMLISSLAIASSVFLLRKLYIIQELCVVCLSTHIINTTLWIRATREGLDSSHMKTQ
mmetsp:Transcript_41594/g.74931  ORF Transcript_41594/g.74931 Transcript_41594/m.74931 type:complete len:169 (+) Transcript_41594:65-571(+)